MAAVDALLQLLKERLETIVNAVPSARAGDVRSVHQARVATRRLRELIPVARATLSGAKLGRLERRIRRMTRVLGPVRELDVALAHLDEVAARTVISRRAVSAVRQSIARERLERRRELIAAVSPSRIQKFKRRLVELDQQEPGSAIETLDRARTRIERRAARLEAAVERAGGLYVPDRLHAVRIAAKKLRYALEVERELRRGRGRRGAPLARLERLQELLGHLHDAEMLIDRTRRVQAEAAGRDRALTAELDSLVRALEAECRRDHAAYMRRRAALVTLCQSLTPAGDPSSAVA